MLPNSRNESDAAKIPMNVEAIIFVFVALGIVQAGLLLGIFLQGRKPRGPFSNITRYY